MSTGARVLVLVVVVGLGTFAVRASFLLFADRIGAVPPRIRDALRMIPPAALSALIAPAVLRPEGPLTVGPRALAAVVALLVAWRTRNLLLTIVVGMVAVVGLEALLG